MDPVLNPYAPGAGRRPPALTGREAELRAFETLVQRCEAGNPDRGLILSGLRGVGKTVLLNEFLAEAERSGWIAAKIEAVPGQPLLPRLTSALHRSLREATGRYDVAKLRRLLGVFRAFTFKWSPDGTFGLGVDVEAAHGHADSGDLTIDLIDLFTELGDTASNLGVGAVILIDEMQDTTLDELVALNVAAHDAGQGSHPRPVVIVGAGLPSLPTVLAEATTYAERLYQYHRLGPLEDDAARAALVVPAENHSVAWATDALDAVLTAANGYPFFLQEYGKHIWDYAVKSPIDAEDVTTGGAEARRQLDSGIYQARWERATPGEQRLLSVVAASGEGARVPSADIAKGLGRPRSAISVARNNLLAKGILYAPDRGVVAFTVPGMADYIQRQNIS